MPFSEYYTESTCYYKLLEWLIVMQEKIYILKGANKMDYIDSLLEALDMIYEDERSQAEE